MSRKANIAMLLLLVVSALFLTAMGTGDSEGPTRIPEPETNYRVTLVDMEGTRVQLTQFSVGGQLFFMGRLGQGQAAIPFTRIKEVVVEKRQGVLRAKVVLKQGAPVELKVKGSQDIFGKTEFGNFRIPLDEVSRIQFQGRVQPQG